MWCKAVSAHSHVRHLSSGGDGMYLCVCCVTVVECDPYLLVGDADLVVIGSGPGGYVAAIKAAQLGMKVRRRGEGGE